MAAEYPEHDKLHKVVDDSDTIGQFLDFGLPKQGIVLYEERDFECECYWCHRDEGTRSEWHRKVECKFNKDETKALVPKWVPTYKTIQQILAEYFNIDQDKIDAEKDEMLAAMRAFNS